MPRKACAPEENVVSARCAAESPPHDPMKETPGRSDPAIPNQPDHDLATPSTRTSCAGAPDSSAENHPVRILAIIVMYKMSPSQSPSFTTLQRAKESIRPGDVEIKLMIYDNSCDGSDHNPHQEDVVYVAATENRGLSHAYNEALRYAGANGYNWLLTLDQDSSLPVQFLATIGSIAASISKNAAIAAIVPRITEKGRTHSPFWFAGGIVPRYCADEKTGISTHALYAFNSAATFRVSALKQVGGYHPWFWLDYSDGYIFHQLNHHGMRVFIAAGLEVEHNFASSDLQNRASVDRYRNMRLAESAFWDLEMGALAGLERTYRLLRLMLKHTILRESSQYRKITCEFLIRRLFWSRKRRLLAWEKETRARFPWLSERGRPPFV